MRFIKNKWFYMAALLVGLAALTAFKFETKKAPQYFTAKVQQGDIENAVQATGTINAVTTVQVGSQVSGTIQTLYADFNSHVKKNQVIAQIDPSLFKGALQQAQADLADAKANLIAAKANVDKAQAAAAQAKLDFDRYTALAKEGVVPAQQLDTAKATYESNAAALGAAQAQVTQASAQVQQKQAAVAVAETNLEHTTIRSPIDGTVVARSVDVGQTVAASLQAPTLFTIAQDLTKMQVYVSTDESDVGSIKPGQDASFKVDAFPTQTFHGKVSAVRLNATTVQNVVTYTTVVDFDNPDMKLFPGMTAYITVPVAKATGVVKVPNAALRYKPDLSTDAMNALLQKNGIGGTKTESRTRKPGGTSGAQADQQVSVVWKQTQDGIEPALIKLGITDHTTTEVAQVLKGSLNAGDQVLTGSATQKASSNTAAPGMGGGRGPTGGARVGR
jgi:HlyD family secretion protein